MSESSSNKEIARTCMEQARNRAELGAFCLPSTATYPIRVRWERSRATSVRSKTL